MRASLLFSALVLSIHLSAQISFEEIENPDDFNIGAVRKSPTGEYFTQAWNDKGSVYSSMDGDTWTREALPSLYSFDDIQFYSDGMPVVRDLYEPDLIRNNGTWHTMDALQTGQFVEATFIRNDTLFVYQEYTFAYSVDRGQTFTTLFDTDEIEDVENPVLYIFDNHIILYYESETATYVAGFTHGGVMSLNTQVNGGDHVVYNECGQLLFINFDVFTLLTDEPLEVTQQ